MIKDEEELECIKMAQRIAEMSLEELLPFIKVGKLLLFGLDIICLKFGTVFN